MAFSDEEWGSIVRRSAETRGAVSRFNTSSDVPTDSGRLVSTEKAKQNSPNVFSRFGTGAADFLREAVPQGVRDVVGRGLRVATSAERTLNLGQSEGLGTRVGEKIGTIPVVGGLAREAFDIGAAPLTLLTAGKGGAIAAALRGYGTAGKIGAALISPASNAPTFVGRLFSEVVMGTAASAAAQKVVDETDNPLAAAAAGLAAGVVAGVGLNAVRGASRTFGREAARAIPGPTDSRTFVRDLLPASEVVKEVDPAAAGTISASPLGRRVNALIDPSKNIEGDISKAVNVWDRQTERGNLLAETALQGAIDSHGDGLHVVAGPRGTVFNVDDATGKILNVPGSPDLIDFLEQRRPAQLRGLLPEQQRFVKDLHQLLDERRDFRVSNGLPVSKNPDEDIVHISRIVRGIRDVDDVGRTSEFIARVHETRAEGIAAVVRYENDLRATVGLMLQADYREVAGNQLDELLAPMLRTPKSVLMASEHGRAVWGEVEQSIKGLVEARRVSRAQRSLVIGTRASIDRNILQATRQQGRVKDTLGRLLGRVRGQEDIQSRMPNADRKTLELYQRWQEADDASAAFAAVARDHSATDDAFASANRALVTANKTLSRVMGEIAERGSVSARAAGAGTRAAEADVSRALRRMSAATTPRAQARARGALEDAQSRLYTLRTKNGLSNITEGDRTGFDVLTAGKGKLRRLDAAQNRVAEMEARTSALKPDSAEFRRAARDLAAAKQRLGRVQGAQAAEASLVARATRTPASFGPRLAKAQQQLDAVTNKIEQMQDWRKDLPKVRSNAGPAITPATQDLVANAQARYATAKKTYVREMESIKASRVAPGYIFGRTEKDIPIGIWKGKFLPTDADYLKLAQRMDTLTGRPLPVKVSGAANLARQVGDTIRLASASGDAAAPFVHGLPLFGQNPKAWAKAALAQYRGLIDPGRTGRYVRQNLETVQEMAQLGIPVGDIEQYLAAAGGAGRLEHAIHTGARSGVGRQTLGRLEAGYDNFLTVARVEAYKSLKPVWDGTPADLATYIRDLTGALSTKALGVSPGARAFESAWLAFSPRLFRSTLALIAHAANPDDPAGRQAARSLLGLMAAASVMAVGTNLAISGAKGETEAQAWKRVTETMDPTTGKFMSVDIGGQRLGVGGQVRAVTQFVAKALAHPSGFATADAFDNPLINFYMGRGSVGVNVAGSIIEGATGGRVNVLPYESIDSLPDAALHLGSSLMPFVIQNQFEARDISNVDRLVAGTTSVLGLNASQKSPSDRINSEAQARHQKPFAELTGAEQQALEADRADLFALRDKRREEFGDRETKQRYATLRAIDSDRLVSERATVDAYGRGQITGAQLRDELKSLQRDAAVQKRRVLGHVDSSTSDSNKQALTTWYDTFDQSKYPGTELIDWDKHAVLEAAALGAMSADQRRYVNERRVAKHDPSVQWFFDNEKTISGSGYYQKADIAFEKVRQMLPETIPSYSALIAAQGQAVQAGDMRTANFLKMVKNRIDTLADRDRTALRRQNPELDHALLENGRVSVLQPSNRARG